MTTHKDPGFVIRASSVVPVFIPGDSLPSFVVDESGYGVVFTPSITSMPWIHPLTSTVSGSFGSSGSSGSSGYDPDEHDICRGAEVNVNWFIQPSRLTSDPYFNYMADSSIEKYIGNPELLEIIQKFNNDKPLTYEVKASCILLFTDTTFSEGKKDLILALNSKGYYSECGSVDIGQTSDLGFEWVRDNFLTGYDMNSINIMSPFAVYDVKDNNGDFYRTYCCNANCGGKLPRVMERFRLSGLGDVDTIRKGSLGGHTYQFKITTSVRKILLCGLYKGMFKKLYE